MMGGVGGKGGWWIDRQDCMQSVENLEGMRIGILRLEG